MWETKGGSFIPSAEADAMIERYQKEQPEKVKSVYFDIDQVKKLLSTDKVAGVSIFFATNIDGNNTVVLKAVDANGYIITDVQPLETGNPCPPYCPK